MAKKKHKDNWERNQPLSDDTNFINTKHWFVPEDFICDLPKGRAELNCDYINKLRIEYVTLRNNGQPKSSYPPKKQEEIRNRKETRLARKLKKVTKFMDYNGMVLRPDFDRMDCNQKPKFTYED